jgi:hypothetical protein
MIDCAHSSKRRPFGLIGDGSVRQLNVNDFFVLGKRIEGLVREVNSEEGPMPLSKFIWHMFGVRNFLNTVLHEPCAMLPASQRAAKTVVSRISAIIPGNLEELVELDMSTVYQRWQVTHITDAISAFETVLTNDMPEMSTYAVSQIGIFRTDDLINGAYRQIAEPFLPLLEEKAKRDIKEAGKCLAFRLSTASAFHICRAVETGIDQFYEAIAGKPYKVSANGGNNNWGAKIQALTDSGADQKVTEFLTHIRKQYRNPVTHPEETVEEHEAADLFITALSAISMMLRATKEIGEVNAPMLPGMSLAGELSDGTGNV